MSTGFDEFYRIACLLFPDATTWDFQFPSTSIGGTVEWLKEDENKYVIKVEVNPSVQETKETNCEPSVSEEKRSSPISVLPPSVRSFPLVERTNIEQNKTNEERKCSNCSTTETTLWRYTEGLCKCNACHLYEIHRNGERRPERLWGKEISKRKRQNQPLKPKLEASRCPKMPGGHTSPP